MANPEQSGFVGVNHLVVHGTPMDYFARKGERAFDFFDAHFRNEGGRHAAVMTSELTQAALLGVTPSSLAEATALFRPGTPAQDVYVDGVHRGLMFYANALRGIVALRELGLDPQYLTIPLKEALVAASDLPNEKCRSLAEDLDALAARISGFASSPTQDRSDGPRRTVEATRGPDEDRSTRRSSLHGFPTPPGSRPGPRGNAGSGGDLHQHNRRSP